MPVNYIPHPIRAVHNDVTAFRAFNTDYQNLTLRPILVIVTTWHVTVAANRCRVNFYIETHGWPGMDWVGSNGYFVAPLGVTAHGTTSFLVPAGWYYHARQDDLGGNASALNRWIELNL